MSLFLLVTKALMLAELSKSKNWAEKCEINAWHASVYQQINEASDVDICEDGFALS